MRRIIFLSLLIFVLSISASYAEVREFEKFTIDIPASWDVKVEAPTITISKPHSQAILSITTAPLGTLTPQQIAEVLCVSLGGDALKVDGNGNCSFVFDDSNGIASIYRVQDDYILFVMNGLKESALELTGILSTLKDK